MTKTDVGNPTDSAGDSTSTPISDAQVEAAGPGVLVDNMSADAGTQISLVVNRDAGLSPGSYYTYDDNNSLMTGTSQLADVPVSPAASDDASGPPITGELCVNGTVFEYAGLGMSLVYAPPPADAAPGSLSSPTPFDASQYSGISFDFYLAPAEAGAPLPDSIHFGVPDIQTADHAADPNSACALADASACNDDFGGDVEFTPGQWTKNSYTWDSLQQETWGMQFTAINQKQLIGMKWQANNSAGADAGLESFNFCISNIYFTP